MSMDNSSGGWGETVKNLGLILAMVTLALFAKRRSFTRPFYWFVIQLFTIMGGLMFSVLLAFLGAMIGIDDDSIVFRGFVVGLGVVFSLVLLRVVISTFDEIEQATFDNPIILTQMQKSLGFIYGLILHIWLLNKIL